MAFFKDKELNDEVEKTPGTSGASTRNVALRVKSYDVEAGSTTGTDIETGDELTIVLRATGKSFDKQGGVHLWSKPKGKTAVAAGENGGVIVFESVIDNNGEKSSRWGVVASHRGDEAHVSKVFARPATGFRSKTELDDKRAIEVARVDQAKLVTDEAGLRESMVEVMSRPYTNVVVRAFDGDELRVAIVWKGKDNTADQAFENFRKTNTNLGRHLNDDSIGQMQAVEVFPLERLYPGTDTREMLRDESKLDAQRFSRDWSLGEGKGWGFGETLLALRTHDEGGRFFTMMLPAVNRQPIWSLDSLPSANIKPAIAPFMSAASGAESAPAPQAEVPTSQAPLASTVTPESGNQASAGAVMGEEKRSDVADKLAGASRLLRRN